jgi:hypothetical protein
MTDRPDAWKSFPETMKKIIAGEISPPNLQPITNDKAVYTIATFHMDNERGQFRDPTSGYRSWAHYFIGVRQIMGRHNGSGMVLYYTSGNAENGYQAQGRAAEFEICKHTPVEDPGANHSRGWHPAHCSTCGLDMSVDSGD